MQKTVIFIPEKPVLSKLVLRKSVLEFVVCGEVRFSFSMDLLLSKTKHNTKIIKSQHSLIFRSSVLWKMTHSWSASSFQIFGTEIPILAVLVSVTIIVALNMVFIIFNLRKKKLISLDSEVWHSFKLIEMEGISHDVIRFRFALHSNEHSLGLPIGQHISLKFVDVDGKEWQRSYTPTTSNDEIGYVDFVIKIYHKNIHPKFPEGSSLITFYHFDYPNYQCFRW